MTPEEQYDDDLSTGEVLKAELYKAVAELRTYRRLSLAARLRGEEVPGYDAECLRQWERIEQVYRRYKAGGVAAMERLRDHLGEDVFNEAARGIVADEDAGEGTDADG